MIPPTATWLAAFLSLGGLELVAAHDAPEGPAMKPRFVAKQLKRQINYQASSGLLSRSAENPLESFLNSLGQQKETSTKADPSPPVVVVPITLSVDAKGVTHTLTGSIPTGASVASTVTLSTGANGAAPTPASTNAESTDASENSSPKPTSTSADKNLGDEIGSFFTSLFNPPEPSSSSSGAASPTETTEPGSKSASKSSSSNGTPSQTGDATSADKPSSGKPSSSDVASASASSTGLLDGIGDTVSSLFDPLTPNKTESATATGTASASFTGTDGNSTAQPTSSDSILPTIPVSVPETTASASSSSSWDLGDAWSSAWGLTGTPTLFPGPSGSSVLIPGPSGSLFPTFNPSLSTILPSVPTGAATTGAATSGPVIPTGFPGSTGPIGSTAIPSATPTSKPTPIFTSKPAPTTTAESTTEKPTEKPKETTTQAPEPTTSSTSESNDWIPSTILVEPPSPTTVDSATHETATATSAPTQLPGSISPAGGLSDIPADSTLIQIGFNGKLRYSFVATTTLSSSQIFLYVPQGLQYAIEALTKEIAMFAIQPYDNSASTGYIATVAQAYIPTDKVDALRRMLHNPISRLYEQPNESVKTLFQMIDPSIPLVVGETGPSSSGDASSTGGSNGDSDNNDTGDDNSNNSDGGASSSGSTRASSVGIGVGVVAGAAAYGAGMFWVARRYRKKRQSHQRSSSTVEQMSEGNGSVFAAGGRMSRNSQNSRGSARTQMISAPVMAENSLGWN